MKRVLGSLALTAALVATVPAAAQAQEAASADINATATVLANVSVEGVNDLRFGDILPGFDRTVSPTNSDAGLFRITGAGDAPVTLSFTLPGTLTGPGEPLTVSFDEESAGFGNMNGTVLERFDPSSTYTLSLSEGGRDIFLGGTVSTAGDQAAGSYTGQVTLEVSYSGS
ncbi:MAG: DUF4402 domain-containing protein [Gemmatimonadales bacterium]|nr:MAG: DUF4402 domain-containing protein [Gemmatimonadales bacterium]